tara:strand:+ start:6470 stop:6862 length:393 start_codon:yes stop_codon:yes gene_type:complete
MIEEIQTKAAPAPVGPYSQAIRIENCIYCSGQIAIDPSTGLIVGNGDIEKETDQVLKNLSAVLNSADASLENVVKTTIYLQDMTTFNKVNKIYSQYFCFNISPARACVEVSSLPKNVLVEIDCIAYIGNI